jgi:hypothetical protein
VNKYSNKGFISAAVSILALLFSLGGLYFYFQEKTNMYFITNSNSPKMEKLVNLAYEQKNPQLCSKIVTQHIAPAISQRELIDECYSAVGIKLNDVEVCGYMSIGIRYLCYSKIAVAKNDISFCDKVADDENGIGNCQKDVAYSSKKIELCEIFCKITIATIFNVRFSDYFA